MQIRDVIAAFGGISKLARRLGHKNPSTVQGWWERGVIPANRQRAVLEAAAQDGLKITADSLIPVIDWQGHD